MKIILAYVFYHIGDKTWNIIDTGILPDKLYDIGWDIYQKTMGWSSDLDPNDVLGLWGEKVDLEYEEKK